MKDSLTIPRGAKPFNLPRSLLLLAGNRHETRVKVHDIGRGGAAPKMTGPPTVNEALLCPDYSAKEDIGPTGPKNTE